ncbi:hypothetical protein JKP88DRAFT_334245 [Tribonema minus]|uniref:Uncharacterized protein n=1 Tax=Tribonema minus TaxID=303371 RepID=A0A835YTW1_9STRA|nr:hypothetical protein JKP88DRAFT_334245 [Tribonema minus]
MADSKDLRSSLDDSVQRWTLVHEPVDYDIALIPALPGYSGRQRAPTTLFSVNAAARWNPSGFAVQAGETYTIDVLAGGQWSTGAVVTDADGISPQYDATQQCWTYNTTCLTHQNYDATRLPPPQGRLLQLVCGVGDMQSAPAAVAEGLDWAMPLREEKFTDTLFAAGSYVEITPRFTGELVCFANDANDLYFDNNGTVTVNVTRLSWPPATTFTESYVQYFSSAPNITLGY